MKQSNKPEPASTAMTLWLIIGGRCGGALISDVDMPLLSMRILTRLLLLALLGGVTLAAEPPHVPGTNEVLRYEREWPVFQAKQFSRKRGDALLVLLDGGLAVERDKSTLPAGVDWVLPVPPVLRIMIVLTNGTTCRFGFNNDGSFEDTSKEGQIPGYYVERSSSVQQAVEKWIAEMQADLRHEVVNAPKPCTYTLGTVDDGSTLSGVAHLFYGDASKWRQIYQANRKTIKNPNVIDGGMKLTIPRLK